MGMAVTSTFAGPATGTGVPGDDRGKATVRVRGELDIATADQAYAYLRDVVDSQDGPVTMNLSELTFCDAAGLGVLAGSPGTRAAPAALD